MRVPGKGFSYIHHSHILCATQQSAKYCEGWENEIRSLLSLVSVICILRENGGVENTLYWESGTLGFPARPNVKWHISHL